MHFPRPAKTLTAANGSKTSALGGKGIASVRSKSFSLVIVQCKLKHLITIVRKSLDFFPTLPGLYYAIRGDYQNVYNEVRGKMAA